MSATILSVTALALVAGTLRPGIGRDPRAVPQKERANEAELTKGFVVWYRKYVTLNRMMFYAFTVLEIGAIIVRAKGILPAALLPLADGTEKALVTMCPANSLQKTLVYPDGQLSSLAATACFLAFTGSVIRIWAQHCLGPFFTWEVSIRPDHKLYTRGPYAVVRHPAYTGGLIMGAGHLLLGAVRGTFFAECIGRTYTVVYVVACVVGGAFWLLGIVNLLNRSVKEDEVMKRAFGKEWEAWAQKTRYRLVPGIF